MCSPAQSSCLLPVYSFCVGVCTLGSGTLCVGDGETCLGWWLGDESGLVCDLPRRGGADVGITLGDGTGWDTVLGCSWLNMSANFASAVLVSVTKWVKGDAGAGF